MHRSIIGKHQLSCGDKKVTVRRGMAPSHNSGSACPGFCVIAIAVIHSSCFVAGTQNNETKTRPEMRRHSHFVHGAHVGRAGVFLHHAYPPCRREAGVEMGKFNRWGRVPVMRLRQACRRRVGMLSLEARTVPGAR